ncbi:2-oxoacid:acceptor oxidoreductase subunit alpha [Clostridium estertheticum]|uniref:2-oxoacid:acceptor oxidoreductase subunit alpha n=1 Tax=Clostridium estertheticum TaxID=238834 RepID=UPI001C7CAF46|nr:2-oxoacid:acceptor oxidoreductase subunit alpha [Clostridium estertheticum]MBX4261584.1 2-oxoacid:acceptor oxidoreductase subunit alpha [Clostridium estertheticum]WLC70916.1 2-oxoacid:acceptor oxidoreductase subunit alpha [Clostridium estertheticum]
MIYNILIGGAAGQGMETLASMLEKLLKRKGFKIFTLQDYMSRVRGGHNFFQIRFGNEEIDSHSNELDGIIALNKETIELHIKDLKETGFVISDEDIDFKDDRMDILPLKALAKTIGNHRVFGSVALGAILKLFNQDLGFVEALLRETFKEEIAVQNLTAFETGFKQVSVKYDIKVKNKDESILVNGNDAIAIGALAAGCKFYSAYPMTPSTSIMNYLASKMKEAEIVVEQAEDEIAAINMAIGASYAGARAMTGTSGGGFALMVEAVGLAAMQEVPLVIAEIQRPGPVTGLPTRTEQADLKFVISSTPGEIPKMVIALREPEDAFYQTMRAFNLADKYQIPVILLGDQFLADSLRTVKPFDFNKVKIDRYLSDEDIAKKTEYKRYLLTKTGVSPRIVPGRTPGKTVLVDSDEHDEDGHITESAEVRIAMNDKRLRKMDYLKEELIEPAFLGKEEFDTLLIGWGSLYSPIKEAVKLLNASCKTKYGALVFGDIWPLPTKLLIDKASKTKTLINIEQNATGQLAQLIRENTGIEIKNNILKYDGRPLCAEDIINKLKEVK